MITQDRLTQRLDELEETLPTIASKTVAFGRATTRRTTSIATAIIHQVSGRFETVADTVGTAGRTTSGQASSAAERSATTARDGAKEVSGQARTAAKRSVKTATDGARQVAGQARSAARRSATTAGDGASEVTGQARAQGSKVADVVEDQAEALIDDATDAVDPKTRTAASFDDLTKAELYSKAQDRDIDGRASMSKDELVAALRR